MKLEYLIPIIFWFLSLIYPSGLAISLELPDKINLLLSLITFYIFTKHNVGEVFKLSSGYYILLFLIFIIIPIITVGRFEGLSYLIAFFVTYTVSFIDVTDEFLKKTSYVIAFMGLILLYIYIYGQVLSGWNDNAISMMGLFSFLYYSCYLFTKEELVFTHKIIVALFLFFLFQNDCRSAMLSILLTVILFQKRSLSNSIIQNRNFPFLLICFPLFISFFVIYVSSLDVFQVLNEWSIENFNKTIFNGRDELWSESLLSLNSIWGKGYFYLNFHNSAVACIAAFGILGFILWYYLLKSYLVVLISFFEDKIVLGCLISFSIIYLQQSVDLGFICPYPNFIPYLILGIGIGRVRILLNH